MKKNSKLSVAIQWFGIILLLAMATLHGSGYAFVKEAIDTSNSENFLKEIIPTLFIHPSIHLIGLAVFGILAIPLKGAKQKVFLLLSLLILVDALLAFNLGGILPGVLLLISSLCFLFAGIKKSEIANPS